MDVRRVVEELLASLKESNGPRGSVGVPTLDPAELVGLQELFVAAGTEAIARAIDPPRWLQLGVEFDDHAQHTRFLHGSLPEVMGQWLDTGAIDRFFFMNKSPGCRLRVRPVGSVDDARARLEAFASQEVTDGRARSFDFGSYEPEVHQFGGPAGMELCHELFTLESRAVLEFGRASELGRTAIDPVVFSLFLIAVLLHRTVGDRWEMWDVWMHMDLTGRRVLLDEARRAELMAELADQREVLEALALEPEALCQELDADERPPLQRYLDGIDDVARRLVAAASRGELCFGLRQILPFCIVFHWNRMRFDRGMQCSLVFYMTQILSPKVRPPAPDEAP